MDLHWEQKVYEIVLRAQEKEGAELKHFLDEVCSGDERTRKEVELRLEGIQEIMQRAKKLLE